MKKLVVAATVAVALFTATVAGAKQAQVKTGNASPRTEKKVDKKVKKSPAVNVAKKAKEADKSVQTAKPVPAPSAPKVLNENKK